MQLLTGNTGHSADRWALISEHPGATLVALVVFGADVPAWSPVLAVTPSPKQIPDFCFHCSVPFRPTGSKIHQARFGGLCGEGILHANKAGGRQKVGETQPWVCCGDPAIPGACGHCPPGFPSPV